MNIKSNGLDKLIRQTESFENFVKSMDGQEVNIESSKTFVQGKFLHQDKEDITEEQSAQFERDNPEVFRWLRSLGHQLENIINQ